MRFITLYYLCDLVHLSIQPDHKLIKCNKNQDPEPHDTGSKSNFLSTYSPSLKNVGTRKSHQVAEASEDFEPSNKVHGMDVTPINCYAENSCLYKQYFQSNKFQVSKPRYDAGPSLQPKIRPIKFLNSQGNRENDSVEYKNCYQLGGLTMRKKEWHYIHLQPDTIKIIMRILSAMHYLRKRKQIISFTKVIIWKVCG